jgi:hypothetical protein
MTPAGRVCFAVVLRRDGGFMSGRFFVSAAVGAAMWFGASAAAAHAGPGGASGMVRDGDGGGSRYAPARSNYQRVEEAYDRANGRIVDEPTWELRRLQDDRDEQGRPASARRELRRLDEERDRRRLLDRGGRPARVSGRGGVGISELRRAPGGVVGEEGVGLSGLPATRPTKPPAILEGMQDEVALTEARLRRDGRSRRSTSNSSGRYARRGSGSGRT